MQLFLSRSSLALNLSFFRRFFFSFLSLLSFLICSNFSFCVSLSMAYFSSSSTWSFSRCISLSLSLCLLVSPSQLLSLLPSSINFNIILHGFWKRQKLFERSTATCSLLPPSFKRLIIKMWFGDNVMNMFDYLVDTHVTFIFNACGPETSDRSKEEK